MKSLPVILLALALVLLGLLSSAFIVNETQQVFITQFGKPVGEPITEPGLKFRVPFLHKVNYFDKRFLEWDGYPNQVPTKDKLYISIDTYARWRIKDPLVFFQKLTDEEGAQTRLDDILDGATRNAVANNNLVELVRSQNRRNSPIGEMVDGEVVEPLPTFEMGRNAITQEILEKARPELERLGIELMDIRFKRINYEQSVQRKIFDRMISERKRIAEKFRSEGQGEASRILGERERELKTIQSEAFRKVQEITGRADAKATAIYADAYNQSPESQDFYRFLKTMETYPGTLTEKDWIILSTESEFFEYLRSATP